jgi:CSLREA domain-containing protein
VEFYKARGDEGEVLIGSDSYAAGEAGQVKSVTLPVPAGVALGADDVIVATATDASGNSSEFSFQPLALSVVSSTPAATPAGTPYAVRVRAVALAGPFRPNGTVRLSDDAGGSCTAALAPVAAALTSEGSCTLSTGGAPRTLTLTANYNTFAGAFGSASGTSVTAIRSHVVAPPPLVVNSSSGAVGSPAACRTNGSCTLAAAVAAANETNDADSIVFAIPSTDAGCNALTGVCRIVLQQPLFATRPLSIDGYTQAGASPNTRPAPEPLDSVLKIEISPASGPGAPSQALSFSEFPGRYAVSGIAFAGFSDQIVGGTACPGTTYEIRGNYFGTDATGSLARGADNLGDSIEIGSCSSAGAGMVEVGGAAPGERNLFASAQRAAIRLSGSGFAGYSATIRGNVIGLSRNLDATLANVIGVQTGLQGFNANDRRLQIGGSTVAEGNIIAGNLGDGIHLFGNCAGGVRGCAVLSNNWIGRTPAAVYPNAGAGAVLGGGAIFGVPGAGNRVEGNAIGVRFGSAGLGIAASSNSFRDHVGLGILNQPSELGTPVRRIANDPGDGDDTNANRQQNFPEITAFAVSGDSVQLSYRVDSAAANSAYPLRVEFYKARGDEGEVLIGSDSYAAGEAGQVKSVTLPVPAGVALGADDVIVATATDASGNSSEFSFSLVGSVQIVSVVPTSVPAGQPARVSVRVTSTGTPFKPNGVVRIGDGRGGTCSASLSPAAAANTAEGACDLVSTGAPASLTVSATYSTFEAAFADASGGTPPAATATLGLTAGAESLLPVTGRNQYATVGAAFATPLRVRVLGAGGQPVAGIPVKFSAPPAGASAALSATTVLSDAQGLAEVTATANATPGRYVVTARVGALAVSFALNNDRAVGSRCTAVSSSSVFFRDDFNGSALDPARWTLDANEGTVAVADGQVAVTAGTVAGFPYVTSLGSVLPAGGNYSLRWVASTTQVGVYGTCTLCASDGLPIDGQLQNQVRIFGGIRGEGIGGGYAVLIPASDPTAFLEQTPGLVRREVEVCVLGDTIEAWVDGRLEARRARNAALSLPNALFFGQFIRGQPLATWSNFTLDLVEVRSLEVGFPSSLDITSIDPSPSNPGQAVTVAVALSVPPGAGVAPTGSVSVVASTGESCTIALPATQCALTFANPGERTIEANYPGDAVFRPAKAAVRLHRVQLPPSLRIDDVTQAEGSAAGTVMRFTVSLDNALGTPVSVQYATAPDTALSPADFAASSGTLAFDGATTSRSIEIPVVADAVQEPDERFFVNLSGASGATIADAQGVGTITNDDDAPFVLRVEDAGLATEPGNGTYGATLKFSVAIDRLPSLPIEVTFRLENGSAQSGEDFIAVDPLTLVFDEDSPRVQEVEVPLLEDTIDEANENVYAVLADAVGATIARDRAEGIIADAFRPTLVVNTNADASDGVCSPAPGGCTLREAIIAANGNSGRWRIHFGIPGSGPHVIRPLAPLPTVTAADVLIDGYTQAGARANTTPAGSADPLDGVIAIELDGGAAGSASGLKLCGAATVRGLSIGGFSAAAILAGCDGTYRPPVRIHGNFLGIAADGLTPRPNGQALSAAVDTGPDLPVFNLADFEFGAEDPATRNLVGATSGALPAVRVDAIRRFASLKVIGNRIGTNRHGEALGALAGTALAINLPHPRCLVPMLVNDNLVLGAGGDGLRIGVLAQPGVPAACDPDTAEHVAVQRNRIGVDLQDRAAALGGVALRVVDVDASRGGGEAGPSGNVFVGGVTAGAEFNWLSSVERPAIVVEGAQARWPVRLNRYLGGGMAIDLGGDGPTPNDPGDADAGPNTLLNAPTPLTAVYDVRLDALGITTAETMPVGGLFDAYVEEGDGSLRPVGVPNSARPAFGTMVFLTRIDGRGVQGGDRVRLATRDAGRNVSELSQAIEIEGVSPLVSAPRVREREGGPDLSFSISLAPPPVQPVTFQYATRDDGAQAGLDYTPASGTVTLSPSAAATDVSVAVLNDGLTENSEGVVLEVVPADTNIVPLGSAEGRGIIDDDDVLVRDRGQLDPIDLSALDGRDGFAIVFPAARFFERFTLAGSGDLDADGRPDLVAGFAADYRPTQATSSQFGSVQLAAGLTRPFSPRYLAPAAGSPAFPLLRALGASGGGLGVALAMLDMRGDGRIDLVATEPARGRFAIREDGALGGAWVIQGRNGPLPPSAQLSQLPGVDFVAGVRGEFGSGFGTVGYSASAIGDLNGDGRPDLALSSPTSKLHAGQVHLIYGRAGSASLPADVQANLQAGGAVIEGASQSLLGLDVRGIGDFNNDGFDDLGIVARDQVHIVFGRSGLAGRLSLSSLSGVVTLTGPQARGLADGTFIVPALRRHGVLSSGGDVDGDGFDDFVFAQGPSTRPAVAMLVFGSALAAGSYPIGSVGTRLSRQYLSSWAGDGFSSVDILPDFSGDGRADVVLGAAGSDAFGARSGTVYLDAFAGFGITLGVETGALRRMDGAPGDRAGDEVRAISDLDGDGLGDLAIGAPGSSTVYVVLSGTTIFNGSMEAQAQRREPPRRVNTVELPSSRVIALGARGDLRTGDVVRGVGDINRDGRVDLVRFAAITSAANAAAPVGTSSAAPLVVALSNPSGSYLADAALGGKFGFQLSTSLRGGVVDAQAAGDFDGDGTGDLATLHADGAAYLQYGRPGAFPAVVPSPSVFNAGRPDRLLQFANRRILDVRGVGDLFGSTRADLAVVSCEIARGCSDSGDGWRIDLIDGRARNADLVDIGSMPSRVTIEAASGVRLRLAEVAALGNVGGTAHGDMLLQLADGTYAVLFGAAALPTQIDPAALSGSQGIRFARSVTAVAPLGRFTAGAFDDLALVMTVSSTGNGNGSVQVYRGRASAPGGQPLDPRSLGPASLGPRFVGSPQFRLWRAAPDGPSVAAAQVSGSAALELLLGSPRGEGRVLGSGMVAVVPGLGAAWVNRDYFVDFSDALAKQILTFEVDEASAGVDARPDGRLDGLQSVRSLGDLDGDGLAEILVNPRLLIRGSAFQ